MKFSLAMLSFMISVLVTHTAFCMNCSKSLCGCWQDVQIDYEVAIVSEDFTPQSNIKITCSDDDKILGISDNTGRVVLSFKTRKSTGCGYKCGELNLIRETPNSLETWRINIPWETPSKPLKTNRVVLGQPYQKAERKDGEYNGQWKEWCLSNQWGIKNGKLHRSGNYRNNLKEGEWTEWYCDGGKKSSGKYIDGKKEGLWTEWYNNGKNAGNQTAETYGDGQISQQAEWHDDKMNGKWNSWHPNGQLSSEIKMHDNKRYGTLYRYSIEGKKYSDFDPNDPDSQKELNDQFTMINKNKPPQNAATVILSADKTTLSDDEKDKITITITVKDAIGVPLSGQDLSYDLPFEIFTATGPFTASMNSSTDNNGQSQLNIWRLSSRHVNAQAFTVKIKSGKVTSNPITIMFTPKPMRAPK